MTIHTSSRLPALTDVLVVAGACKQMMLRFVFKGPVGKCYPASNIGVLSEAIKVLLGESGLGVRNYSMSWSINSSFSH